MCPVSSQRGRSGQPRATAQTEAPRPGRSTQPPVRTLASGRRQPGHLPRPATGLGGGPRPARVGTQAGVLVSSARPRAQARSGSPCSWGGGGEPRPTVGPASLGVATTTLRPNVRLVLEPASASRTQGRWLGRSWHRGHWNRPPWVSWSSRVVHPESPGLGFQIPLPPTSPSHEVSEMRGAVRWRLVGPRGGPGGPSYLPM